MSVVSVLIKVPVILLLLYKKKILCARTLLSLMTYEHKTCTKYLHKTLKLKHVNDIRVEIMAELKFTYHRAVCVRINHFDQWAVTFHVTVIEWIKHRLLFRPRQIAESMHYDEKIHGFYFLFISKFFMNLQTRQGFINIVRPISIFLSSFFWRKACYTCRRERKIEWNEQRYCGNLITLLYSLNCYNNTYCFFRQLLQ